MKKLLFFLLPLALFANFNNNRVGFQGFFEVNTGAMYKKSNSYTSIPFFGARNHKIDSIKDKGNNFSTLFVLPKFNLKYKNSDGSGYSFGVRNIKDLALSHFRHTGYGKLEVGYQPGFEDDWDNPYRTEIKRGETKVDSHGVFLSLDAKGYKTELFYNKKHFVNDKTESIEDLGRSGEEIQGSVHGKSKLSPVDITLSKQTKAT